MNIILLHQPPWILAYGTQKTRYLHENEKIDSVLDEIGVIFEFYYEPDLM